MKVRFNRWYNAVLTALLALLGYESCESSEEYGVPIDILEYGVPSAKFQIKGQVTDEAGTPIQGIKMSLRKTLTHSGEFGVDSVQTDVSGKFLLTEMGYIGIDSKLIAEDVDGESNGGEFQSDTLDIDFEKAVLVEEGDGNMKGGTYETYQDIKLKKK